MKVFEGTGGITSLDADDQDGIEQTTNQEVLKGMPISFRSTSVRPDGDDRLHVTGDLELVDAVRPIAFVLTVGDDGRVAAIATVRQTGWG